MAEYHCAKFQVQSSTLPELKRGGGMCRPQGNTRPKKAGAARVKQKAIIFFWETDFIAFQQSKNSFVVAWNNLANEIDQASFILTTFHELGKVTWDFKI